MGSNCHISDITRFLERFAPRRLAEDWDNVGLLVGDTAGAATRVLTCLTLTPDVAAEAIAERAELIVSHHPIMFRPIQQITAADVQGKMLLELIAAGIAVYSPHTSYDSAAAGINQQLAEMLSLKDIAPLRRLSESPQAKIVCFVPQPHLDSVREALWKNGAGHIGEYSSCSFNISGTGTFHGEEGTNPTVGQAGRLEHAEEIRVEVICPQADVPAAVAAMIAAHPYEEPAYDVYPLIETPSELGAGRSGTLDETITLGEFNRRVKSGLGIAHLQYVGDEAMPIRRVAIACGAAAQFLRDGRREGCEVLLTGEARFHDCLEARNLGMGMVLPGHYATERPAMQRLADVLAAEFPGLSAWASSVESDPVRWDV